MTVLVFAATALFFIVVSWRWRLAIDSPVMHYVVFLLRHGLKPYREISDNNMPGAYLAEAVAMRLFGPSDLAWRLYEFSLLGVLTLALARLARGWDWTAGVFAGLMFLVLHANEGPQYSGERELVLTVLLLLAYLALFTAVDRLQPVWMLPFGLLSGLAASIKPTYLPLPIAVLALALLVLHRRRQPILRSALYALAGLLSVFGLMLAYLVQQGVLQDFLFVLRTVTPAYLGIPSQVRNADLILFSLPHSGFLLLFVAIPLAVANWRREGSWSWKQWAFLLGAAFGLLSYLIQHKGFSHHRYTFCVFLYLLAAIEVFRAVRQTGWPRIVAAALAVTLLAASPHALSVARAWSGSSDLELSLEHDLQRLGGAPSLDDQVQCFDLVYGCLNALYHGGILENTGFTGDLLFFSPGGGPATAYYRERYRRAVQQDPPSVLVVSNEELLQHNSYDRLRRWPAFADTLQTGFVQVVQRSFPQEWYGVHSTIDVPPPGLDPDGYRIYLRRGSPALAHWQATALTP